MFFRKNRKKVFVAMSGGVDSSVSAALLKQQGYEVTGVFMKQWSQDLKTGCSEPKDLKDARKVALALDIPFLVFDFTKEYEEKVVNYMIEEYRKGLTPNPDVMCNKYIKFGLFFEKAMSLGADYIATGHYAIKHKTWSIKHIGKNVSRFTLHVSRDKNKDQSYFLWTLNQEVLAKTLFPVGNLLKPQVRKIARKFNLPVWNKKDSQGVCFVGKIDVKGFLKQHIKERAGDIMTTDGKVVGQHDGVEFYTIGQRHGFSLGGREEPYFVVGKDIKKNILYVGQEDDPLLYKKEVYLSDVSWIGGKEPPLLRQGFGGQGRTRYRQALAPVKVSKSGDKIKIEFVKPQKAIAPGQSAVIYRGSRVLGGGITEN